MDFTPISESLAAVMRNTVVSDFVSAQGLQYWLGADQASLLDTLTGESRGRFSEDETHALVGTVAEVALPYSRLVEAAAVVEFDDAGSNYG